MIILLSAICLLTASWPGDVPFINDEPSFIYKALRANQNHELARSGLIGSRGIPYGPLPVWMYQAMLLVSPNLIAITVLHGVLMSGSIAVCLVWLARTLRLNPWFAVAVLVSPYTWFYNRALWDSLNLPLTSLAIASYASFLDRPRRWTLATTLMCLALLPMVHLMTLAFVLPVLLHVVIFRRRQLARFWPIVLAAAVCGALAWIPYARALFGEHGIPKPMHGANGWWFPLLGARLISGANLAYLFTSGWMDGASWLYPAWAISLVAYPLFWLGLVACAVASARVLRTRSNSGAAILVPALALAIVLAQVALDGIGHISTHPHYYNGTWIVFPLTAWLGFDFIGRRIAFASRLLPIYVVSLAILTAFIALRVHANRGVRSMNYGVAVGDEIALVRDINALGAHGPFAFRSTDGRPGIDDEFNAYVHKAPIITNVPNFLLFPHSLNLIQELIDPGQARSRTDGAVPGIVLAGTEPESAEVRVVEMRAPPKR